MPIFPAEMSQASSAALVVNDLPAFERYEEPSLVPGDDELSILLSFRMELPLIQILDVIEVQAFIPPASRLWPYHREEIHGGPGKRGVTSHPQRPLCLMTLIAPTPTEEEELSSADLLGLLGRLKSLAKQMRRRPDHSVPEILSQLLYTIVNVVAMVRCQAELHTIGAESLGGNIRWFLKQTWLDDRIRPLFQSGLAALANRIETCPTAAQATGASPVQPRGDKS
jgi:hypothetical protein